MAHIEKQRGKYRARFTTRSAGSSHAPSPARPTPSASCARSMPTVSAGLWVDPRDAEMPLAEWAEEFLLLCRRLSPTTQETYRRDLDRYVLPRFGSYRLGRLPADEIENWLNDEIAAGYRAVLGPPPLPDAAPHAAGRRREAEDPRQPVRPGRPAACAEAGDGVPDWEQAIQLAEAHPERYRALIYLAVDSGMRWSELIGLRRGKVDLRRRKVRVTEQLVRLEDRSVVAQGAEDPGRRSVDHDLAVHRRLARRSPRPVRRAGAGRARLPQRRRQPAVVVELPDQPLPQAQARRRREVPVPRPPAHQRRPRHRRWRAPEGHPGPHGPLVDQRHPRPLRPPVPRARRGDRRGVRSLAPGGRQAPPEVVVDVDFGRDK